jgi:hypothetical protein
MRDKQPNKKVGNVIRNRFPLVDDSDSRGRVLVAMAKPVEEQVVAHGGRWW